jgi:carnitine 3-dehydrogenase
MRTVERTVPIDWTDYNGHMNESRYGQVFSDAADAFMIAVGADADYIAAGHSFFTAETTVKYLRETHAGQKITVDSRVVLADGKKVKLSIRCLTRLVSFWPAVSSLCCT